MQSDVVNNTQSKKQHRLLQIKHLILAALLFITLAFIGYLSTLAVIKIELDSKIDDKLQIYWEDENSHFSEAQSKTTSTQKGRHSYWLVIHDFKEITQFRIDPTSQKTHLKIYGIDLYSLQYLSNPFDLFNDSTHAKQLKQLNQSESFFELESIGNDPQISFNPVLQKKPAIPLLFLIVIIGLIFGKRHLIPAVFIFSGLLLFYSLLSLNEATLSFQANVEKAGQLNFLWRNKNEKPSKTRTRTINITPEKKHYQTTIKNISNIEFVSFKAKNDLASFNISNSKIKDLGFKDISFSGTDRAIEKRADSSQLYLSSAIFLIFCGLFSYGVFYYSRFNKKLYSVYFPKIISVFFLLASYLVFNLAWQSNPNIHPDENAHLESVKYFSLYSDFPKIGDSRALKAYQAPWALSRLDDIGITYFLAGKFRNLIHTLFNDDTFITRSFNVFLFMLFFVLGRNKRLLLFLTPLICTPQIWYLFSYANRGAVVLFISLLLAWQLINKTSALNQFLHADKVLAQWKKILYPGLLLGILTISQSNYALFILYLFSILFWNLIFSVKNKKIFIYKCFIFISIGAAIFSIRTAFDVSINGFNKAEKRTAYAESDAEQNFKPSIASTKESYSGLRLKDKGVRFTEMFNSEFDWHKTSFKSFVGYYGYYAEYSPKWYYSYVFMLYVIPLLVIISHAFFKTNWQDKLFAIISLTAVFGGLLMSFIFCWTYDFQPQGRYTFPIIPILLVFFWKMFPLWNRHEKAIILSSVIILAILSFYSFYEVALNYLIA